MSVLRGPKHPLNCSNAETTIEYLIFRVQARPLPRHGIRVRPSDDLGREGVPQRGSTGAGGEGEGAAIALPSVCVGHGAPRVHPEAAGLGVGPDAEATSLPKEGKQEGKVSLCVRERGRERV